MKWLLLFPFLQGLAAVADEWCFHRRRGLPAWEIWGHPLDTLTVGGCFFFLFLLEPSFPRLVVYSALAAFSSLFVTKDEFLHKELCSAEEQWLHSLLFLLHPVSFGAAAFLWWEGEGRLLALPLGMISLFFIYQVLYWGKPWRLLRK